MKNAPKHEPRLATPSGGRKRGRRTEVGMAMLSSSMRSVEGAVPEIEAAAEYLAGLMRAAHGGAWSININHNSCFVVVSRDFP